MPKEVLYYGSIIVNLEAGTAGVPVTTKPRCTGKKPLGILDISFKKRTTDVYVDGKVLYRAEPSNVYSDYKRNCDIPKATVIFKVSRSTYLQRPACV